MKLHLVLICSLFSSFAFSATRLQFFIGDQNSMALITPTDIYGTPDSDSSDLYQMMDVPEQDTMLGKGKAIISADRDFNLVCGQYKQQCQVMLTRSSKTTISSFKKVMRFAVTGDEAAYLTSQFKLNNKGEAYFLANDKKFRVTGDSESFIFEATAN